MVVQASGDSRAELIAALKVDLFGCAAGAADHEVSALVDPLLPPSERDEFHQLYSVARFDRGPEQEKRYAVFQTAVFGNAHVRVLFGVVSEAPRRTVWLDRYTPGGIQELVLDAPTYPAPCDDPATYERQRVQFGKEGADKLRAIGDSSPLGLCDSNQSASNACYLDPGRRSSSRSAVASAVMFAHTQWSIAMSSLRVQQKLKNGQLVFDQRLTNALRASLFDLYAVPARRVTKADHDDHILVLTADQLAGRTSHIIRAPTDRAAYGAYLSTLAGEWADNIVSSLSQLADRDLEALAAELKREQVASQSTFEQRLQAALQPFER